MRVLAVLCAGLLLTACATRPEVVVVKNHYEAVKPGAEFFDENKCPWPAMSDYLHVGSDLEASDYIHAAYSAWTCEHLTRMKIKEQSEQQAADIAKRNESK